MALLKAGGGGLNDYVDPYMIRATNAAVGAVLAIGSDGIPVWDASSAFPVAAITPGTARQVIQTNAGATAAEWTDSISLPGSLAVATTSTLTGSVGIGGAVVAGAKFALSGNVSAVAAAAIGSYLEPTLVAIANSDRLTTLRVEPLFTPGAFTSLQTVGLDIRPFSVAAFTSPASPCGIIVGAITGTGATAAVGVSIAPPTGATTNYLIAHNTDPTIFNVKTTGAITAAAVLTISAGGAAITGNSTIVGTLGSVTTLTAVTGTFTGAISSNSASAGIGYATGAGTAQNQSSSKATTVAANALCGTITMNNATLNAATIVSFTFTNTSIALNDILHVQHESGGTVGAYTITAAPGAGTSTIFVRNNTAGNLAEALVLRFIVLKAVAA